MSNTDLWTVALFGSLTLLIAFMGLMAALGLIV